MPHRSYPSVPPITFAIVLVLTQAGCVALNIPSRRHHDPSDRGGLFGDWRPSEDLANSETPVVHSVGHAESCHDGCGDPACENWCGDAGCGIGEASKPLEIPWPRFHPVPTRPIFGSPSKL